MTIPSPGPGAGKPAGKPVPSPGPGARKPIPSPGPGAGKQIPSPGPARAPDRDDPTAPGPAVSEQARPEQARTEQARPEQARPDRAASASLPPPPPEIASGTRTRSRPPWSYVYAALGLAALALALAVGALATGTTVGGGGSEQDRKGALEATRERTLALTSYDYRKLDEDFAGVLATSTGPFSQVVAAGLESFESDRAVAVVAVDQQIAAKGAQPRAERNRLRMTLVRDKDVWLVEKVERL